MVRKASGDEEDSSTVNWLWMRFAFPRLCDKPSEDNQTGVSVNQTGVSVVIASNPAPRLFHVPIRQIKFVSPSFHLIIFLKAVRAEGPCSLHNCLTTVLRKCNISSIKCQEWKACKVFVIFWYYHIKTRLNILHEEFLGQCKEGHCTRCLFSHWGLPSWQESNMYG